MIVFNCPYCNVRIEVDDSIAGRDGRCRTCKNMITVPSAASQEETPLSPSDDRGPLEKKLDEAVSRADNYHVLLLLVEEENKRLRENTKRLIELSRRVTSIEQTLSSLESWDERPHENEDGDPVVSDLAAALDAARQDIDRLATEQAAISDSVGTVSVLAESGSTLIHDLFEDSEALRHSVQEMASALEQVRRELEEERAIRERLVCTQQDIQARVNEMAQMIDGLKPTAETLSAGEVDSVDESAEKDASEEGSEDVSEDVDGKEAAPSDNVDEGAELTQQMMRDAFLRFIRSVSDEKK